MVGPVDPLIVGRATAMRGRGSPLKRSGRSVSVSFRA